MPLVFDQFCREPLDKIPNPEKRYYMTDEIRSCGFTYLMKLVVMTREHPKLIKNIKKYRTIIDSKNDQGWTALMFACFYSSDVSSIKTVIELINCGASVNLKNRNGWTALHMACRYSNTHSSVDTVKLLIHNGAQINNLCDYGSSPLMISARNTNNGSSIETVRYLISRGANINIVNNEKMTAFTLSCGNYSKQSDCPSFSSKETIIELIRCGSNFDFGAILYFSDIDITYEVILRYKSDPHRLSELMTIMNDDQLKYVAYNKRYIKKIISKISLHREHIYDYPTHINSLLWESNFFLRKSCIMHMPNKLHFLFNLSPIKN